MNELGLCGWAQHHDDNDMIRINQSRKSLLKDELHDKRYGRYFLIS